MIELSNANVNVESRAVDGIRIAPMVIAATGAAMLLLALSTVTTADSDLWGHLRFGLDLLSTGRLTAEDPYSFTQDRPWINHEWFSELHMAVAYAMGGIAGLALLKGALVAGALGLAWFSFSAMRPDIRIVLFAALAAGTVPITRTLRPQLWTMLLLAVICWMLTRAPRTTRRWFPLLFVIWANSHGGWIVGLGVVGCWMLLEVLEERKISLESLLILLGCLFASLCTPYGWRLWEFLATTVSLNGRAITEWQPLWRSPPADAIPWIATLVALAAVCRVRFPHRVQTIGVLLMLAYASLKVVRIVPLFVLVGGMLLGPAIARRWPKALQKATTPAAGELPLAIALVVLAAGGTAWILTRSLDCIRVDGPRVADAAAVDMLRSAPSGRLVTFFDWGEYGLWHLGPSIRVSMDGRRETVYSDARLDEHGAVLEGTPAGFETLARWQPEYVWLPATSRATRAWLASQHYRIEHDTVSSFVAVRADLPALGAPAPRDARSLGCFPG